MTKHWEGIFNNIRDNIINFSDQLYSYSDNKSDSYKFINDHYKIDLSDSKKMDEALIQQNTYNCCKEYPDNSHLTTGHIFKIDSEYWICLTPACDLVPGQKNEGRFKALSPSIPFKAVKMHIVKNDTALEKVNENQCLFLFIKGKYETLLFTHNNSNPIWEEMYAENSGIIGRDNTIKVARLKWNDEMNIPIGEPHTAEIVSQLRYEYALNLLQRLGSSLMRIGLDFVSRKKNVPAK